jgi:hypothetical protein
MLRKVCLFGAVFLVLTLACAEIPELLTVCDNASNDFLVNPLNSHGSASSAAHQNVVFTVPVYSNSGICFRPSGLVVSLQVLPLAGQDLLTLLSLQRE